MLIRETFHDLVGCGRVVFIRFMTNSKHAHFVSVRSINAKTCKQSCLPDNRGVAESQVVRFPRLRTDDEGLSPERGPSFGVVAWLICCCLPEETCCCLRASCKGQGKKLESTTSLNETTIHRASHRTSGPHLVSTLAISEAV